MQAASNQFVRRIHGNGRGWTFSQADFSDLAGRSNGDIALHRLHEAGKIRRILVATDFSEHSKRVVQYAFDLKRIFNASIYMLYVVETPKAIEFGIRQGQFSDTVGKMKEWATNQLVNLTPDEFIQDSSVVRIVESGAPITIGWAFC